jgi:hypothetical protein
MLTTRSIIFMIILKFQEGVQIFHYLFGCLAQPCGSKSGFRGLKVWLILYSSVRTEQNLLLDDPKCLQA